MTSYRALSATVFVALLLQPLHPLHADPFSPRSGSYEVTARLELPPVQRWAVDKIAIICILSVRGGGQLPVLSANNPFAKCTAANLVIEGATLQYDIVCPERGAARAHATYSISPDKFTGHVAMVMGAKNMTMTEVQRARRVGDCGPADSPAANLFRP
jgi:Protein of unknown function (DUF3617)